MRHKLAARHAILHVALFAAAERNEGVATHCLFFGARRRGISLATGRVILDRIAAIVFQRRHQLSAHVIIGAALIAQFDAAVLQVADVVDHARLGLLQLAAVMRILAADHHHAVDRAAVAAQVVADFAQLEILLGNRAGVLADLGTVADDLRQIGEAGAQVVADRIRLRGRGHGQRKQKRKGQVSTFHGIIPQQVRPVRGGHSPHYGFLACFR